MCAFVLKLYISWEKYLTAVAAVCLLREIFAVVVSNTITKCSECASRCKFLQSHAMHRSAIVF